MKYRLSSIVLSMVAVILAVFTWTTFNSQSASAATFPIHGNGVEDAMVMDNNDEVVNPNGTFNKWEFYIVSYNWSVPDGTTIHAGDTAEFELPEGLAPVVDRHIPIYNATGQVVAYFDIKAGSNVGTMTSIIDSDASVINRKGTLTLNVKGTGNGADLTNPTDWTLNKVGWITGRDPDNDNFPTQLTWNIAFNPEQASLQNVKVIDMLSPGQEYIPYTAYAPTGYYENGQFVPDGGVLTPKITVNGSQITFDFGDVDKAVNMTYNVKVTGSDPTVVNKWSDNAQMFVGDKIIKEVGGNITWTGSGNGNGNLLGSVILTKTDAQNEDAAVVGATYDLLDATGNVIQTGLKTDTNGQITVPGLPAGNYSFAETSAPEGYVANSEPVEFTINPGETTALSVTTSDQEQAEEDNTGFLHFTKQDSSSKAVLQGAVYSLFDSNNKLVKDNLTTDDKGVFVALNLEPGNYTLVETGAPKGYEVDPTPIPVVITAGGKADIVGKDTLAPAKPGSITLTKVDSSNDATLAGAVYTLKDSEGKIVKDDLTTDANGQITIPDLVAGTYTLIEKTAPEGYDLDTTPITVIVTAGKDTAVSAKDVAKVVEPEPEPPVNPTPEPPVEPGVTEPGVTEPGTTEPGTTEPGTTEPGITEPGVTEPVKPSIPGTSEILSPNYPATAMPSKTIKKSLRTPSKGRYPQTGNVRNDIATAVGILVALFITYMMFFKKEHEA
ncbi:SpaA isopeptide-forming pilin-related protein [Companilactobacillus mishanensis]|nr:SpaA isopeptide-forming pilin-related protein [Companilactobacillus mishanensis]